MSASASGPRHGRCNKPQLGAALACVAMSFFSLHDALIKWLATDYWLIQLLFFRSVIIVAVMSVVLSAQNGYRAFHTTRRKDHLLRTFFNFAAFISYYLAIARIPLADATAIALSAPLIMTALSGPLLGEPADWPRKIVLLTGFAGVLIVIQPAAENIDWLGVGCALLGAFLFAMLGLQTRRMAATESSELMVFFAAAAFLLVTGGLLLFHWEAPNADDWLLMVGLGIIALFAQLSIVNAYQCAAVYVIAPFEYVAILWALCLGWFVFGEVPTATMLSGAALVVACGVGIVYLERSEAAVTIE